MVASPSKPLRLVVGIDGGGTSTKCVVSSVPVSSSAVIVGVGEGGSANANSVGFDAALENVAGAIVAALRDATRENFRYRPEDVLAGDVEGVKLEAIALSCAGVDDDDGKARWRDALASLCVAVPPRRVVVANDAAAALASGTRGRLHGVVLISGTGTIACGYTEDGARARAAGWGPAFGDAGCAHSIGSALLALAARVADGRVAPSSPGAALVPEIMEIAKEKGVEIVDLAVAAAGKAIEAKGGKIVIKEAARAVSERDDRLLAEKMEKLAKAAEEEESGSEEEDETMGDVDIEKTALQM